MQRVAYAALALLTLTAAASARPAQPQARKGGEQVVLTALDDRATACFAETILSNGKALKAARAGRWYEAAGVAGYLCRPEVGEMMRVHDGIAGKPGAGLRYFRRVYVRHLEAALSARIGGDLARTTVANAEPPEDRTGDAGAEVAP